MPDAPIFPQNVEIYFLGVNVDIDIIEIEGIAAGRGSGVWWGLQRRRGHGTPVRVAGTLIGTVGITSVIMWLCPILELAQRKNYVLTP